MEEGLVNVEVEGLGAEREGRSPVWFVAPPGPGASAHRLPPRPMGGLRPAVQVGEMSVQGIRGRSEGVSLDPKQQLAAVADVGHDLLFELGHLLPEKAGSAGQPRVLGLECLHLVLQARDALQLPLPALGGRQPAVHILPLPPGRRLPCMLRVTSCSGTHPLCPVRSVFPPASAVRLPWPQGVATLTGMWWGLTVAVCFPNN